MKKEYLVGFAIALFALSLVLDSLAGPLSKGLSNPFDYLKPEVISVYPFTTVSIAIKTVALFISITLAFSLVSKMYMAKAILLFVLAALLELYSIQQIATGSQSVPKEWSLAFAWTGVSLILPIILFILLGAIKNLHQKISKTVESSETSTDNEGVNP